MTKEQAIWECDKYANKEGNLNLIDGVNCEKCKNKAYIMRWFENGIDRDGNIDYDISLKQCECKEQRDTKLRQARSGMGQYLTKRAKDYIVTTDWQKICKDKMMSYCKDDIDSNKWFMACGQSGSGKTLLVSIIANYLLNSFAKEVRYIVWTDFIGKLKRDLMNDNVNSVEDYLYELKKCDVLYIDELLKVYTQTDLKYVIEIINYRYTNNLKTLITTEKNINELLDIDEATFSRVIEKCSNYIVNIPKDKNKNYRLKHSND